MGGESAKNDEIILPHDSLKQFPVAMLRDHFDCHRENEGTKELLSLPTQDGRTEQPLILYDGNCGFCKRSVHWLLRHDRYGALRAEPNQSSDISPELRAACQNAVHVVTAGGQVLKAGRACLYCGRFTRWNRVARLLEVPPLIWGVEIGYWLIANNRSRVSGWLFADEPPA